MKIESLAPLPSPFTIKTIEKTTQSTPSFAQWLIEKMGETNTQLLGADKALQQLASGQAPNLHQTMLTLEQAKLSLQLLGQIRNRLVNAYQELMREQI